MRLRHIWRGSKRMRRRISHGCRFRHMWRGSMRRRKIECGCRFRYMWRVRNRISRWCSRLMWRRIRRRRTMWWSRGCGWLY
jgi:hypothetical protein